MELFYNVDPCFRAVFLNQISPTTALSIVVFSYCNFWLFRQWFFKFCLIKEESEYTPLFYYDICIGLALYYDNTGDYGYRVACEMW